MSTQACGHVVSVSIVIFKAQDSFLKSCFIECQACCGSPVKQGHGRRKGVPYLDSSRSRVPPAASSSAVSPSSAGTLAARLRILLATAAGFAKLLNVSMARAGMSAGVEVAALLRGPEAPACMHAYRPRACNLHSINVHGSSEANALAQRRETQKLDRGDISH